MAKRISIPLSSVGFLVVIAACLLQMCFAEPAEAKTSQYSGLIATGSTHTCVVRDDGRVLCWGDGFHGQLGYGAKEFVGENPENTPGRVGPVDLGVRNDGTPHTAKTITAGYQHTCVIRDDGRVLCWGENSLGQLGYGNTQNVGDNPENTPGRVGPINLGSHNDGTPFTARSITAGGAHTCAVRDDKRLLCWGRGEHGQLGYGNTHNIGDNETPGSVKPIDLGTHNDGTPFTAKSITAATFHTCVLRDDKRLLCWGNGSSGRLGYGNTQEVGRNPATTPAKIGPINLGTHNDGTPYTAKSITAGAFHTCAVRDDESLLCWGLGNLGRLGYGNTQIVGDNPENIPGSVGPVDLGVHNDGTPHTVKSIDAGGTHTCAARDDGHLLCWGLGEEGQLGYGNTENVGDTPETIPGEIGPVDIGGLVFRPFTQELAVTIAPANKENLTRDIHVGETVLIQITLWNKGPLSTGSQTVNIEQILNSELLDVTDIEPIAKEINEEDLPPLNNGIWKINNLEPPKPPIPPETNPLNDEAGLLITATAVKPGTQKLTLRYPNPLKTRPVKQTYTLTIRK